jgi:D-sedoheptulose 7-phosphate isomerase
MKDSEQTLGRLIADSREVQTRFFDEERDRILKTATTIAGRIRNGGKVLLFGNGGSAADAQHIAAEFVGRFGPDRPALPALSLAVDPSVVTAVGNDYGFESIFARQVEAHGRPGDTAIGISTSGNSPNVLRALRVAREAGLYTIGLTGESGGKMPDVVDVLFRVPSTRTPRIQETHIMIGHFLAELIDRELYPSAYDD